MKLYLSRELSTDRTAIEALSSWTKYQQRSWLGAYERGAWELVFSMLPESYFKHCAYSQASIRELIVEGIEHGWTEDPNEPDDDVCLSYGAVTMKEAKAMWGSHTRHCVDDITLLLLKPALRVWEMIDGVPVLSNKCSGPMIYFGRSECGHVYGSVRPVKVVSCEPAD